MTDWRTAKVHPDHHIACQYALYSVPSATCPPGQKVEVRLGSKQEWEEQGVWEHIWLRVLRTLDEQSRLDWSQAFLDGSFVPAKKGERTSTTDGRVRGARST